ncbi:hypothetical protein K7X08_031959 [Anisodus acutangulus]|uniref:Uncharacterized protein n=1 Tax=Anisodus acutangulus TaxID=402998 RepID=A0A9Q1RM68_9SOLA|nr:hypothetical protein K7X08_031959 [Anisodus acutangulus]
MALRLSGILMGGVVIVYERKVKLLYEDVTRLMVVTLVFDPQSSLISFFALFSLNSTILYHLIGVQINEAWKVKAAPDPTLLPKSKLQAKHASVTLPDYREEELPEIEQTLGNQDTVTMMDFEQTSYFAMRLDNADLYDKPNAQEEPSKDLHQVLLLCLSLNNPETLVAVDADNITLVEHLESHHTDMFNHFERFDIEGDEETQMNFTQPEDAQIPSTPVPSQPKEQAHQTDEIPDRHPEDQVKQQSDEAEEIFERQDQQRPKPARQRARKAAGLAMDNEQTIIAGDVYQSWLQSSSDIASRTRKKRKTLSAVSTMKIARLMEVPPIALLEGLLTNGNKEVHYPAPLLKLWMRNTQPPHDSPSGKTSSPNPPEPSYTSPAERMNNVEPVRYPFEDFQGGVGSPSVGISIEKQRANLNNNVIPPEILMEDLRTNLTNMGLHSTEANGVKKTDRMATPGSGDEPRSIPSSGDSHGYLSQNSVTNSSRSNKKRPHSSHSGNGLQPVAEENPWHDPTPNFKLTRLSELSEKGFTQDNEMLMETGSTQTQHPFVTQPLDVMTDSIRMQLKSHFDTPGSAEAECLNELTLGMTKKEGACLFYQTCGMHIPFDSFNLHCSSEKFLSFQLFSLKRIKVSSILCAVLATRDFIKVEQEVPYGDILISRGAKM